MNRTLGIEKMPRQWVAFLLLMMVPALAWSQKKTKWWWVGS